MNLEGNTNILRMAFTSIICLLCLESRTHKPSSVLRKTTSYLLNTLNIMFILGYKYLGNICCMESVVLDHIG